jgi:hypothetical protein
MKNRIAAQTARDRKKAKMGYLEETMNELETENDTLHMENRELREETEALKKEKASLKRELEEAKREAEELRKKAEGVPSVALGSAASINAPLQRDQATASNRFPLLFTLLTTILRISSNTSRKDPNASSDRNTLRELDLNNNINLEKLSEDLTSEELSRLLMEWKETRKKWRS